MPMHPHRGPRPSAPRRVVRRAVRAGGWLRRCGGRLGHGIAALLVVLMLFSRVAVAAYACPVAAPSAMSASAAAMPCGEMEAGLPDPDQPLLCQQHCSFGHGEQSGPQEAPQPAPEAPSTGWWPLLPVDADHLAGTALAQQPRQRDRPPPLPLRTTLCCLRP